ncbi:MAG: subclass B3 metallo-beta-lactamase [Massilia sp.]
MNLIHRALACALLAGCATPVLADNWNAPQEPFAIYGNTYYVGPRGVSAVLITSPAGHILIDGGSVESPTQIAAHIRQLGFKVEDVKYILNSHEHHDHAGGIAALQKMSGATVIASEAGALVLRSGKPGKADPQYSEEPQPMGPAANVRAIVDGGVVTVGNVRVTAHATPGHTPGGTSWAWQSSESGRAANMVYADSLSAYAEPPFRYMGSTARTDLEHSIATVASLPCDILISAHPEFSDLWERKARAEKEGHAGFIDTAACKAYADKGAKRLKQLLAEEAK